MSDQPPSVGRIVHYVAYGTPGGEFPAGVCRAAIITETNEVGGLADALDVVSLCVLNPTGLFFNRNVPYDPGAERCSCGEVVDHSIHNAHPGSHAPTDVKRRYLPGTWHWPERV